MFDRLYELTLLYLKDAYMHMSAITFTLYILLSMFFLFSRRMNARAEAPMPSPRLLPQLARQLQISKPTPMKQRLSWLLEKTDWLLCKKLKLLPDADTGRRLNFFMLLFASWLVPKAIGWVARSAALGVFYNLRDDTTHALQARAEIQVSLLIVIALYLLYALLPFFLMRKNRELYFDVVALFALLYYTISKLIVCWWGGCCPGIPCSWGVYREVWQMRMFPVELAEFTAGVLGVVLCILYMLRARSYRPGRGCSFCALCFAVIRFSLEFLRYDVANLRPGESNIIFGWSVSQVACVGVAALSVVWLFVLPLEKKLMDRLWEIAAGRLEKLLAKRK